MTDILTTIQTPTNDLAQSLDFYRELSYHVVSEGAPTLVTDGQILTEINPERTARAGLKLWNDVWEPTVAQLQEITNVIRMDNGYMLSDPSGVRIYLVNGQPEFDTHIPDDVQAIPGSFAGISIETTDFQRSTKLWETLGYEQSGGGMHNGYASFSNGSAIPVNIMNAGSCPHLFFNPSYTYFNGEKNLEIIEKIRKAGVPITEEITCFNQEGIVDNIIIRDPGGFGYFIFND